MMPWELANITTVAEQACSSIRVVTLEGNPWFVAADVRKVLGIQKGGTAFDYLDSSEKKTIRECGSTPLKGQGLTIISESGLYKIIMRSDKPQAKDFQNWVTKEVLPSIRKTGSNIQREEKAMKIIGPGTKQRMQCLFGKPSAHVLVIR